MNDEYSIFFLQQLLQKSAEVKQKIFSSSPKDFLCLFLCKRTSASCILICYRINYKSMLQFILSMFLNETSKYVMKHFLDDILYDNLSSKSHTVSVTCCCPKNFDNDLVKFLCFDSPTILCHGDKRSILLQRARKTT